MEAKFLKNHKKKTPIAQANSSISIIAIGASAGGLEAIQEFLSNLPPLENACLIVAQHLSPTHKSRLVHLLSRETELQVTEAESGKALVKNNIYITPPDKEITIIKGKIFLQKPTNALGPKPSVDVLFQSLSQESKNRVIGIILSGTGSDGAEGVKFLKKNGKYTISQEPLTAKYDGMPLAAIHTGMIDVVMAPEKMGEAVLKFLEDPVFIEKQNLTSELEGPALAKILNLLGKRTGTDFSDYKTATVGRRLEKRMAMLHVQSIDDYLKILESNPREADEMFQMLLIGVTSFFRDMEAFGAIEDHLHKIINFKGNLDSIRIWVPGCSTGEEAYSLGILLHRILKDRIYPFNIQIFATDIDEEAIAKARKALYPEASLVNLPTEIKENYFTKKAGGFELIKEVRTMVLFSKHDLIRNPPFLKLDLISCRNLLIYFNANLQQKIIPIFHYALLPDSYLFLGKSETVGHFSDLFASVDPAHRIFQRKRGGNFHSIKFSAFKAPQKPYSQANIPKEKRVFSVSEMVKETLFNTYEHPYVVINEDHDILEVNGDVRLFVSLQPGTMQVNLLKMINRELHMEVRAVIHKAIKERVSVLSDIKRFDLFGTIHYVRINAKPLIYTDASEELFVVIFEKLELKNVLIKGAVEDAPVLIEKRIEELEYELKVTKAQLQTYIQEIETSNEELQSLNEEMQSTNEELQSSNEELETSNEELQSTNEEIQVTYTELKSAHEELELKEIQLQRNQLNTKALLNNELQAFLLVDISYKILEFNAKAESTFLILQGKKIKIGNSLRDYIAPGQMEEFMVNFNKALKGKSYMGETIFLDVESQPRWYKLHYFPVILENGNVWSISISILDITDLKQAQYDRNSSERLVNSVFNAVSVGICITDEKGVFVNVNEEYCKIYGFERQDLLGKNFTMVLAPLQHKKMQELHNAFIEGEKEMPCDYEVITKEGKAITVSVSAELLLQPDGSRYKVTSVKDISDEKKAKEQIQMHRNEVQKILDSSLDIICTIDVQGNFIQVSAAAEEILGYLPGQMIGRTFLDFVHPEDKALTQKTADEILEGKEFTNFENRYLHKAGHVVPIVWSAYFDKEDNLMYCVARDATEKKIAEERLKKNELRFRTLVENAGDAFAILGPDGKASYVSPSINKILGYTEDEALHLQLFEIIHPDDAESVLQTMKQAMENPGIPIAGNISRTRHRDGSWRWMEATITNLLHDPNIGGVVDNFRDVTEKMEFVQKLHLSNERYNYVTKATFDAIWDWDIIVNKVYWGDNYFELYGKSGDQDLSDIEKVHHRLHPEELDAVKEHASASLLSQDKKWAYEHRYLKSDGSYAFVSNRAIIIREENGRPIRVIGAMRDITQQKEEEHRLKLMEGAIKNTNDGVVVTVAGGIGLKGQVIFYSNEAFLRISGYPIVEVIGQTTEFLFGPNTDDKELEKLNDALKNGNPCEITTIGYKKNKDELWINYSISPVKDTKGNCTHWVGILRDVTQKKNEELQNRFLSEISQIFNNEAGLIRTLEIVLEHLVKLGDFDNAEVWLVSTDNNKINLVAGHYKDQPSLSPGNLSFIFHSYRYGEGLPGIVWKNKRVELWENQKDGKEKLEDQSTEKKASLGIPMFYNGKLEGVLVFGSEKIPNKLDYFGKLFKNLGQLLGSEIKRKQAEEELNQLFLNSPDILCIVGPDGYFTKVNPAFCNIMGYNEKDLTGQPFHNFIFKEDLEGSIQEFDQTIKGSRSTKGFVNRYITKSGSYRWISWDTSRLFGQDGYAYAYGRDITETKELQDLLENATNLARIGGWELNLETHNLFFSRITREIHEVNDSFKPDLESAINFYRQDVREFVRRTVNESMRNGSPWDFELPIITRKGNERWIRSIGQAEFRNNKCIRIFGSIQDIHQRKVTELRLQNTADNIPGALFQYVLHSDGTDEVLNLTKGARELWGVSAEDCMKDINQIWDQTKKAGDFEDVRASILNSAETMERWHCQYRSQLPNGRIIWHEGFGTPQRLQNGSILWDSLIIDITEKKELEFLLDRSSKMAHIGSWELVLGKEDNDKMYWSPMTRAILEVEDNYDPTLSGGFEFYDNESKALVKTAVEKLIKEGQEFDLELFLITAKGNPQWVRCIGQSERVAGRCIKIWGSFQDIHRRKETEIALRQSEARHRGIIASQTNYLIRTDLEGKYTFFNKKFVDDFGWIYKMDDLIGQDCMVSVMKYHHDRISAAVEKTFLQPNEAIQVEVDKPRRGGGVITTLWDFVCLTDANGQPEEIQCVGTDISDRISAERELQNAFDEKNTILESIGDAFFSVDKKWTVTYWNKEAAILLEINKVDILGKGLWDIFSDAINLESYSQFHKAMETGQTIRFEDYYQKVNKWFEISAYPSKKGLSVYFKDVSIRKIADEQIRQSNQRFEKVTEATNDAIWDWDITGNKLFWGGGFNTLFGYNVEKITPTLNTWKKFIHEEDKDAVIHNLQKILDDPALSNWIYEYRFLKKNGDYAFIADRGVVIRDSEGNAIRMVGAMTDISHRKEYEKSLKELNEKLESHANELAVSNAELEHFAYIASHDLQEPLRMVTNFLSQLEKKYKNQLDEKANKYIHFAVDGATRMRQIILDLLEYSRIGRNVDHRIAVDTNEIMKEVCVLQQQIIGEKKAKIYYKDLPVIESFRAPTLQVFQNLISNALKYTIIGISPEIHVEAVEKDNLWQFSVRDNGLGIEKEFHDKIFVLFQRLHTKEDFSGTGMGLSIVKKIINNMGGTVWVDSKPGKGSTFFFTISKDHR